MSSVSLYGSHLLLYCYYYYSFYGDEGSSHPFMCRMEYFWWLWVWHSFFFFLNISFSSPVGSLASGLRAPWRVAMAFRHAIWPASKKSPLRWQWGSTRPLVSGPPLQSPEFAIATWAIVPNGTPLIGEKWETFLSSLFLFCLKKIYIFSICHLWYISAINVESLVLCFVIDNWRMWIECFYLVVLSPYTSFIIKCSTSCGKGMRHRRVYCQGFDGRDVGESDCSSAEKPSSSDICDMGSCSANTWFFTEWSGQVRLWPVFLSIKKKSIQPKTRKRNSLFSNVYFVAYWLQQCSEECGTGKQTRKAHCSSNSEMDCDVSKKPDTSRTCVSAKDCSGKWFAGPWSQVFTVFLLCLSSFYDMRWDGSQYKGKCACLCPIE